MCNFFIQGMFIIIYLNYFTFTLLFRLKINIKGLNENNKKVEQILPSEKSKKISSFNFNYEKSLSMIASGEISNDINEENNNLTIESNNVDNDNIENENQSNDYYDHFYD